MTVVQQGFSSSDVVTILVSLMALVISVIALMLARRQVSLSEQQLLLAKRQDVISLKQAEIAELQHKELLEQRESRPRPSLVFDPWETDQDDENPKYLSVEFYVRNDGRYPAKSCTWHIAENLVHNIKGGERVTSYPTIEGTSKSTWSGQVNEPISRGQFRKAGIVQVEKRWLAAPEGMKLWWYIDTDGARYPENKLYEMETVTIGQFKKRYQ